MKRLSDIVGRWTSTLVRSWGSEFRHVMGDVGVLIFFLLLPIAYPIVYTLIYNPEVVREIPMAIVDNSRTAESRKLVRMIDATEYIDVVGVASSLQEAKEWARERKVYSVMEIPSDYAENLGRNEQAVLPLYCDMSLMIRYRNILFAMTDVTLALGSDIRTEFIDNSPVAFVSDTSSAQQNVGVETFMLGDPTQGFASFIMIGLVVLILQQSMILGILMLGGGSHERRMRNGGIDPEGVAGPVSASLIGKALCVVAIYAPLTVYILHYIPVMFGLPQYGSPWQYLPFMLPFLLSSAFLGLALVPFCRERESSFLIFVFTSVIFLFLSGLTWPRTAMSPLWAGVSSLIPASWGMEGFIGINSNAGTLALASESYTMLWVLTAVYFVIAVVAARWDETHRLWRLKSKG